MGKIDCFEEIIAWQKARELCKEIYTITSSINFSRDYSLRDQIRRASVSVSSNIAEGFERQGKIEFIRFLTIAKASCGEVRSQLYLAFDLKYLSEEEFNKLKNQCIETSKTIGGLISYLKSFVKKVQEFKEDEVEYNFKSLKL